MYVGLIVRDECERSVKTQASKDEKGFKGRTSGFRDWLATVLREAYQQKELRVKHMTRR